MSVEIIIILYIYLCLCMVLFNIAYLIYRRRTQRFIHKRNTKLKRKLQGQFLYIEANQPLDEQVQKSIFKQLKHLNGLIAFHLSFTTLKESRNDTSILYFQASRTYFEVLAQYYAKRPDEEKAYFSYLMSIYACSSIKDDDKIAESMIMYMNNKSAYVRENALKSLYKMGNVNCVLRAFRVLNLNDAYQNVKLLSDGLLSFRGDHEELMSCLWNNFEMFSPSIQVSLINYIRMKSANYSEKFSHLLDRDDLDKEVKFAVVRYYRKHYYAPILGRLIHMMLDSDENRWEYAAISASTLENFPSQVTYQSLRRALKSTNWYVRFNAADSLIHHGLTPKYCLSDKLNKDKYAKEMLTYRWENHENKLAN